MSIAGYGYGIPAPIAGGVCEAIADAIDLTLDFDPEIVITPTVTSVADPIDLTLETGDAARIVETARDTFIDTAPRTVVGDHGGAFIGRTGNGRILDTEIIAARGFTILEEEETAGQTTFFVHAPLSVIQAILENPFDNGDGLTCNLFEQPVGEIITAGLIKFWTRSPPDENAILRSH